MCLGHLQTNAHSIFRVIVSYFQVAMGAAFKFGELEFNGAQFRSAPSNDNAVRLSLVAQPKRTV